MQRTARAEQWTVRAEQRKVRAEQRTVRAEQRELRDSAALLWQHKQHEERAAQHKQLRGLSRERKQRQLESGCAQCTLATNHQPYLVSSPGKWSRSQSPPTFYPSSRPRLVLTSLPSSSLLPRSQPEPIPSRRLCLDYSRE